MIKHVYTIPVYVIVVMRLHVTFNQMIHKNCHSGAYIVSKVFDFWKKSTPTEYYLLSVVSCDEQI